MKAVSMFKWAEKTVVRVERKVTRNDEGSKSLNLLSCRHSKTIFNDQSFLFKSSSQVFLAVFFSGSKKKEKALTSFFLFFLIAAFLSQVLLLLATAAAATDDDDDVDVTNRFRRGTRRSMTITWTHRKRKTVSVSLARKLLIRDEEGCNEFLLS